MKTIDLTPEEQNIIWFSIQERIDRMTQTERYKSDSYMQKYVESAREIQSKLMRV